MATQTNLTVSAVSRGGGRVRVCNTETLTHLGTWGLERLTVKKPRGFWGSGTSNILKEGPMIIFHCQVAQDVLRSFRKSVPWVSDGWLWLTWMPFCRLHFPTTTPRLNIQKPIGKEVETFPGHFHGLHSHSRERAENGSIWSRKNFF